MAATSGGPDNAETVLLKIKGFAGARLDSLYSDFCGLSESNPEGFEANVNAWINAINQILLTNQNLLSPDLLLIHADAHLQSKLALSDKWKPLALAANAGTAQGKFIQLDKHFESHRSYVSFSFSTIASLLQQLSPHKTVNNRFPARQLVSVTNLETVSNTLLSEVRSLSGVSNTSHLYTFHQFYKTYKSSFSSACILTEMDMRVVIEHYRKKRIVSVDNHIIRVNNTEADCAKPITESDIAIAQIRESLQEATHQETELSNQIAGLNQEIEQLVASAQRTAAIYRLKRRKILDRAFTHKAKCATQLQEVLQSLDSALTNRNTLLALESGSKTFQSMMKDLGGMERVEKVMDQVHENILDSNEVDRLVREGPATTPAYDEGELERELEQLSHQTDSPKRESPKLAEPGEDDDILERLKALHVDTNKPAHHETGNSTDIRRTEKAAEAS